MDKVKVPSQSKQSIENVFDNLQSYIKSNVDRRIQVLFSKFGVSMYKGGTDLSLSLTSGTEFTISPGTAITAGYEWIKINNITTFDLSDYVTVTTDKYYVIKLEWASVGSDPVNVANSFNYDQSSSLPADQRFSKYSDSYTISVSEITTGNTPTATSNQVIIGMIKALDGSNLNSGAWSFDGTDAVSGVIDLRDYNLLAFSNLKVDNTKKLTVKNITSDTSAGVIFKSPDDNIVSVVDSSDNSVLIIDPDNNSIGVGGAVPGASTAELVVSGDISATGDIYSAGYKVVTEEVYSVPDIINFRVTSITALNSQYLDPTISADRTVLDDPGTSGGKLRLTAKWGYEDLVGSGAASGLFTITNSPATFALDELAGYWFYVPGSPGKNYYIHSNTATSGGSTVLTLHDGYLTLANVTGVTLSDPNFGNINHNVTSYELIALPKSATGFDYTNLQQLNVTAAFSPVIMQKTLDLFAGSTYQLKVRGVRGGLYGDWVTLPNGSFSSFGQTYSYGNSDGTILVKHVDLDDPHVTISATASLSGFKASINPSGTSSVSWSYAEEYEFAWTNTGAISINYGDPGTYQSKITNKYAINVSNSDFDEFTIACRPLIGRLAVDDAITTSVVGGSGGYTPPNNIIATVPVRVITVSGANAAYTSSTNTINLASASGIESPANSGDLGSVVYDLVGQVITIEDTPEHKKLRLVTATGSQTYYCVPVDGSSYPSGDLTGKTFEINTSKIGRLVKNTNLSADTRITKIEVESVHWAHEAVTVRVYQNASGRENFANTVIVNDSDTQFETISTDLYIRSAYGDRTLAVDLWDPAVTGALNDGTLIGTINIYGQTVSSIGTLSGAATY